jgi:sulfur carrier protein ThiS
MVPAMNISVQLHTILQRQTPEGRLDRLEVELPEGSSLADLIEHLEITLDIEDLLLVVNGRTAELDTPIQDGDQVNLIPAISGG